MARTELVFDILARDKASQPLDKVGSSADRTGEKLQRTGERGRKMGMAIGAGLAVAGVAAVKFAGDSVRAYVEAEQASIRLDDALARFPKTADVSRQQLDKLNTTLAKKTRFDDDATASAQALLAQFDLTGKQIAALTPLVQDYAARTGRDLPDAAEAVGKAMLGQGRALKEVGIDFKDTGSVAGNFEQVMSGLRTQVGGFAEKEGKTAAGQAEIMRNRFGEIKEEIGERTLPILLDLSGWIVDSGIPALEDFAVWIKNNKYEFIDFGATAGQVLLIVAEGVANLAAYSSDALATMTYSYRYFSMFFLNWADIILTAADTAFGWIPGIGDKISDARATFESFKSTAVARLNEVQGQLRVSADRAREAADEVAGIRAELGALKGKTVYVDIRQRVAGETGFGGLIESHGGDVITPSMPRLPGDAPDERTRRLQIGEVVLSRAQVQAGAAGGGARDITLNITAESGSVRDLALAAPRALRNVLWTDGIG